MNSRGVLPLRSGYRLFKILLYCGLFVVCFVSFREIFVKSRPGEDEGPTGKQLMILKELQRSMTSLQARLQRSESYNSFLSAEMKLWNVTLTGTPPMLNLSVVLDESSTWAGGMIGCPEIDKIKLSVRTGWGYSKKVETGSYRGRKVALKSVNLRGKDVTACVKRGRADSTHMCYMFVHYKLLKEAAMIIQLHHPNIVNLLGMCVRSENVNDQLERRGVVIVMELGKPLSMKALTALTWNEKVRKCIEMLDLIHYITYSPIGVLSFSDYKPEQFVLIDGKLKLIDLDDMSDVSPTCVSNYQCYIGKVMPPGVKCVNGTCHNLVPWRNVNLAIERFIRTMMSSGRPGKFLTTVDTFITDVLQFKYTAQSAMFKLHDFLEAEQRAEILITDVHNV